MASSLNKVLIIIDSVEIFEDTNETTVEVSHTVFPHIYERIAVYNLKEVVDYVLTKDRHSFHTPEYFLENCEEQFEKTVSEFHYSQTSHSLATHIENLNKRISRLTSRLVGAINGHHRA